MTDKPTLPRKLRWATTCTAAGLLPAGAVLALPPWLGSATMPVAIAAAFLFGGGALSICLHGHARRAEGCA